MKYKEGKHQKSISRGVGGGYLTTFFQWVITNKGCGAIRLKFSSTINFRVIFPVLTPPPSRTQVWCKINEFLIHLDVILFGYNSFEISLPYCCKYFITLYVDI